MTLDTETPSDLPLTISRSKSPMKKHLRRFLLAVSLAIVALTQTQCASTGGSGSAYSGLPYPYDDPMMKQIRMQEQMSRVTRSLMPF